MLSSAPVECPQSLLDKASPFVATPCAVVNAASPLSLQSARQATEQKLIKPVLVGHTQQIKSVAKDLGWDISGIRIEQAEDAVAAARIAVSLARNGDVKSLMKGDIHTDQLLKAVIDQHHGLLQGKRLSHVFHMTVAGRDESICITEAVINILPDIKITLDIARNVTGLMHALGTPQPRIALLSASEVAMPSMPSSMQAEEVVKLAALGEVPGAIVGGPFAFDNAVSTKAAKLKGISGPVAGKADVLLVPNIETGNALFKMMVYYMSAAAAGIVLGAKVPIILTSRADPVAARLAAAALASIYVNQ